jgi:hypothetical protein
VETIASVTSRDLVPPGGAYYERLNQLDVGIRKIFRIQKYQCSAQADFFNVTNVSYVKSQNVTLGSSFGQPLDVLQPRLLRLAVQMKFQRENSERAAGTFARSARSDVAARPLMRSSRRPCDGDGR